MITITRDMQGLVLRIEHGPAVRISDAAVPTALGPAIAAALTSTPALAQARMRGIIAGHQAAQQQGQRLAQWHARQARARARARQYGLLLEDAA